MSAALSTRPPPPPERIDLARQSLRRPIPAAREERHKPADEAAVAAVLANLEGRLLVQIESLKEELQERDRPSQVHIVAPPLSTPEKKHWLVTAGTVLAGVLTGAGVLAGALAGLWGQLHKDPTPELTRRVEACEKEIVKHRDQWSMQYTYDAESRALWRGAFEQLDVRFPYAPGEPVEPNIAILAPPLVEPNRVKKAARIQPSRPIPLPPPALVKP